MSMSHEGTSVDREAVADLMLEVLNVLSLMRLQIGALRQDITEEVQDEYEQQVGIRMDILVSRLEKFMRAMY